MRASADPISVIPDDVTILPITACAAALSLTERKARQLLHEEQIPVARLGARSGGVRLSHVRRLLEKRER
jgi:hypothetical protein